MVDLGDTEARPLVCAITMSQEAAASCADIERDCVERSRPVIDLGDTEARPLIGESRCQGVARKIGPRGHFSSDAAQCHAMHGLSRNLPTSQRAKAVLAE